MKRRAIPLATGLVGAAASLIAILTWLGVQPPKVTKHAPAARHAKVSPKATKASVTPRQQTAPQVQEKIVDSTVTPVAGAWQYHGEKVSVGGKVFEGYGSLSTGTPFATFDARDWDKFTVSIGVNDDHSTPAPELDVSLEVDGHSLWEQRVKAEQRPETLQVTLTGNRAVTVRCVRALNADGTPYAGEISDLVFAEPKLGRQGIESRE